MTTNYGKHYNKRVNKTVTKQGQRTPGIAEVKNQAGGFTFAASDWDKLDRFLVLGNEGGSYYAGEKKMTRESAKTIERLIKADGLRVVRRIVEISDSGRAPKNDPALFALALCAAADNEFTRKAALAALPKVARISTHLFHFLEFVKGFRGWGRALKTAVQNWYQTKPAHKVAFQAVKYKGRDGWTHKDVLRLAKPVPVTPAHSAVYKYMTTGELMRLDGVNDQLRVIEGHLKAHKAKNVREIVSLIGEYRLPREAIPTEYLTKPDVWSAMLPGMPATAMIRNLGNMTKSGLITPLSDAENMVVTKLGDAEWLQKSRVHPIQVLTALLTYSAGRSVRGKGVWSPSQQIVDALDAAFYSTFKFVEPSGGRWGLFLDVSGSMSGPDVAGVPGLSPFKAEAALALVTANVERQVVMKAFSDGSRGGGWFGGRQRSNAPHWTMRGSSNMWGRGSVLCDLDISKRMRLDTVMKNMAGMSFGGTDCAAPMVWAKEQNIPIDTFVVYTDSETWAGNIKPHQALRDYRQKMGINAKLIVVGMVSNGFTIADPNDPGMLDVVGFDSSTPQLMSTFAGGFNRLGCKKVA